LSPRLFLLWLCFTAALSAAPALGQEYSEAGNLLTHLTIKDVPITAEVVDTPDKVYLGLGHRQELPEGRGMLFVIPTLGRQAFCMRDMLISIDIFWIAEGKVVGIHPKLSPSDQGVFISPGPVRLVLEVPGGFADRHGIEVGDPVALKLSPEAK
jgi:uncharacterized protein